MIFDVCSILFGTTPENFYAQSDGASSRKTRWYKVEKGVFGNTLAFIGVVEDHAKGTLHYHILVFGGVTPYVLQRFVYIEELNKVLAETLDTMYQSSLPTNVHIHNIIRTVLQENTELARLARDQMEPAVRAKIIARQEPLFERTSPLEIGESGNHITLKDVQKEVGLQCVQQENHLHLKTCRSGFLGKDGCRLCMPHGTCPRTQAVKLEPNVPSNEVNNENDQAAIEDDSSVDNDGEGCVSDSDGGEKDKEQPELSFKNVFKVKATSYKPNPEPITPVKATDEGADEWYRYTTQHIYEKNYDKSAIVWEIACPEPESLHPESYTRNDITDSLAESFKEFPTHRKGSDFWEWLVHLDDLNFFTLYDRIVLDLVQANGHLAAFNSIISYCTGSHNNCQMLGGIVQAKGA